MSPTFQAPRGTHDVLPADRLWWRVVRTMEEQCAQYGWSRVYTPGFEETALFERTSGEASDVVHKEMYTFEDRSDRSLTLRPEGTAPIARAYVEHGLAQEPQPIKAYAIAPMYRYARPGRGRYREHWQLSLEAIGSEDPAVDAEVIQFYAELLRRLGVTEWTLILNSIGDANCRPLYVEQLKDWLDSHPELLEDEEIAHKRATSVLQVFDVKNERVRAALDLAPKIGDSLCDECREHFAAVKAHLDAYGVPFVLDASLVRGLDYYTRTTFEFVGPEENVNSSLVGGGRYDGLVEAVGGAATPGVGFGAGLERLLIAMEREGATADPPTIDLFVAFEEPELRGRLLPQIAKWRAEGRSVDTDYAGRSMKGQLTQAQRLGAETIVVARSDGTYEVRQRGEEDRVLHTLAELW
jgi:histidyl-tRNA synthetase